MSDWWVEADGRGGYRIVYDRQPKSSGRTTPEKRSNRTERTRVRIYHTEAPRMTSEGDIRRNKSWPGWTAGVIEERGRRHETSRRSKSRERSKPRYSAPPACPDPPAFAPETVPKRRVHFAEDEDEADELLEEEDQRPLPPVSDDLRAIRLRQRLSGTREPQYPSESSAAAEARQTDYELRRRSDELSTPSSPNSRCLGTLPANHATELQALDYIALRRYSDLQSGEPYPEDDRRGRRRR